MLTLPDCPHLTSANQWDASSFTKDPSVPPQEIQKLWVQDTSQDRKLGPSAWLYLFIFPPVLSLELKTAFASFFLNGTVQGTSLDLDN